MVSLNDAAGMPAQLKNVKIARVATTYLPLITLIPNQLLAINNTGASITVITSDDEFVKYMKNTLSFQFKALDIKREIDLISDIRSLLKLIKLFRKEGFDIVHSITPKAGLLCSIAARLTGVPVRLHTFTGQTWVNTVGFKRLVLKCCDKLIGLLSTHCYADSLSQRSFLLAQKIIKPKNITVLGSGSLAGVDLSRFNLANFPEKNKTALRNSLGIQSSSLILLFIGRITQDKGIFELLESAFNLKQSGHNIVLIVVGSYEKDTETIMRAKYQRLCGDHVVFTGFCAEPEKYISIADILCLPSYREGFGTVVIEAAAMEVPVVGTKIYGLTDAVVDGETGILVEPRNVEQLTEALHKLLFDNNLRARMKINARERACKDFCSKYISQLQIAEYVRFMSKVK